jgi:transposase-like protein
MIYICDTGQKVQLTCPLCGSTAVEPMAGSTTPLRSGASYHCHICDLTVSPDASSTIDMELERAGIEIMFPPPANWRD